MSILPPRWSFLVRLFCIGAVEKPLASRSAKAAESAAHGLRTNCTRLQQLTRCCHPGDPESESRPSLYHRPNIAETKVQPARESFLETAAGGLHRPHRADTA